MAAATKLSRATVRPTTSASGARARIDNDGQKRGLAMHASPFRLSIVHPTNLERHHNHGDGLRRSDGGTIKSDARLIP